MSKKQWLVLLMLFLTYLLLGASIFYYIESRLEVEKVEIAKRERIEINRLLNEHYVSNGSHDQHEILDKLTNYCGKSVHNYTEGDEQKKWDFYNSFYFAYTVVSTIGYGNLAPTNMLGRVLMIFYALIGIPINGILLSQLGEFFSETFVSAVQRYKAYKKNQNEYSKKSLNLLEKRRFGLAMQILTYLIPGFIMFIFFPAFLFSYYEQWTYDEAVYYAFVTLTTIGFGDYVAGQDNTKGSGVLFIMYKMFLIVWILFGLGYIVMIITFIGRGMTSKKIARIEHKLAIKIKNTQSKIWNEFNEDVNYFRRTFNELQFSKVKRVYVNQYDYNTPLPQFSRSNSFPNLRELVYGGLELQLPPHPRRRTNSEVVPMEEAQVARVVSETDLQRIDKNATFATHAMVQPAELLARLVNILGYIPPDDDEVTPDSGIGVGVGNGGVQGFSDKEILASETPAWNLEKETKWKFNGDSTPKPYRSRAHSEVRLDRREFFVHPNESEWTWSGPASSTKIQEIMRARKSTTTCDAKEEAGKSRFLSRAGLGLPKSVLPRWIKQFNTKKPGGAEHSINDTDNDANSKPQTFDDSYAIAGVPGSRNSYSGNHLTHTGDGNNILEETSVADFLRALTALHSRVGAVPDELANARKASQSPQRKLGTASLTPPKLSNLLTLFSPPVGHSQSQQNTVTTTSGLQIGRRFSLRTAASSSASTPMYQRRATQGALGSFRFRRFSLKPVASPITPTPPHYSYSTNPGQVDERPNPPPYSPEPFVLDNPKKPLVKMEGAPGVSSPVAVSVSTISSTGRRFSLRPAQIGVPPAPSSSSSSSSTAGKVITREPVKAVPRWKAGMLQRQIVQHGAQHKVQRAYSLSDVNLDDCADRINISPLALHNNANTITSIYGQRLTSGGKTVTIVSPELSRTKAEHQQSVAQHSDSSSFVGSSRFRRYNSDIESVSSKSSSYSSNTLDKDLTGQLKTSSASSASSSSRNSSFGDSSTKNTWDDEWDFPPTNEDDKKTNTNDNSDNNVLTALAKESDVTTRKLSGESNKAVPRRASKSSIDVELASAATASSIVSIGPWIEQKRQSSLLPSMFRNRASSSVAAPDRRIVEKAETEARVEKPKSDDVRINISDYADKLSEKTEGV